MFNTLVRQYRSCYKEISSEGLPGESD